MLRCVPLLRLVSYLAPSLPEELFLRIARHVEAICHVGTSVRFERAISGPLEGDLDPFADGTADVGFVCAPSYRWLRPTVEQLPVPVPLDPRADIAQSLPTMHESGDAGLERFGFRRFVEVDPVSYDAG